MMAPSGEVVSIATYEAMAATSPTGVPEQYMRGLVSGERLLPTGEVRMPSGKIVPMTESLYLKFGTHDPYIKQLEATLGHKLYALPRVQYMSTSGAITVSGLPRISDMRPGVLYVQPMAPTLKPGVYKPAYYYIDPVTGQESSGVTPPVIKPGYTSYIID